MEIPVKKLESGFEMPAYGIGTWQMGGRDERNFENDDEADIAAIRKAIDLGVTHIDTAEIYAEGHAEELVGKAIAGYDRKKLFLVSKVAQKHLAHDDVIAACKASLVRIGTDYLDLYLLHRPNHHIPIDETMNAMDELLAEGLIKNIGVSNFSVESFDEAQAATKNKIVANQVHYNLRVRGPEVSGLLSHHQKNDVMLIAWRPVQKGLLADEKIEILEELGKKYKKTPAQIAINWLISQENVVTLAKTTTIAHLEENLGAIGWKLSGKDIEMLRREFPGQEEVSNVVPLS